MPFKVLMAVYPAARNCSPCSRVGCSSIGRFSRTSLALLNVPAQDVADPAGHGALFRHCGGMDRFGELAVNVRLDDVFCGRVV